MRRRSVLQGAAALVGGALLPECGSGLLPPDDAARIMAAVEAELAKALHAPLATQLCGVVTGVDLKRGIVTISMVDGLITGELPLHDCSNFEPGQEVEIETCNLDSAAIHSEPFEVGEMMTFPVSWADGPLLDSYNKEPRS